jgi:hypothetical protein
VRREHLRQSTEISTIRFEIFVGGAPDLDVDRLQGTCVDIAVEAAPPNGIISKMTPCTYLGAFMYMLTSTKAMWSAGEDHDTQARTTIISKLEMLTMLTMGRPSGEAPER